MQSKRPEQIPASDGEPAIATTLNNLCSTKQLVEIRNLSNSLNVDVDAISKELFKCKFEELSKSGADDVIRHLERAKNIGAASSISASA